MTGSLLGLVAIALLAIAVVVEIRDFPQDSKLRAQVFAWGGCSVLGLLAVLLVTGDVIFVGVCAIALSVALIVRSFLRRSRHGK